MTGELQRLVARFPGAVVTRVDRRGSFEGFVPVDATPTTVRVFVYDDATEVFELRQQLRVARQRALAAEAAYESLKKLHNHLLGFREEWLPMKEPHAS